MRRVLLVLLCSSCATSPEAPLSNAQLSGAPDVRAASAKPGFVSYGAPYHKWTISFAGQQGCGASTLAAIELNTLASVTDVPIGTISVRTLETTIPSLPSAYIRYMNGTVVSGTVTIESASSGFVVGEVTSQLMINGTATDVSGSFGAPVCPE